MSPVCRDETLAGLKINKWNLENMLTRKVWYERQIHALFNEFSIKNNIIHNIDVSNHIFC